MSGLYINEISFVHLIGLQVYYRVIGVCVDVVFAYRFCGK